MTDLDAALDGIWDVEPGTPEAARACRYLDLILEGRDPFEADRIVAAGDD
jgi:hypothetical protein